MDARFGGACAGAAATSFEQAGHAPGCEMGVDGACRTSMNVAWPAAPDPQQQRRTWNDADEAAEHGAYGVAALLVDGLTDYTVWERAKKGKGFDFWLRKKGDEGGALFQGAARMEVSGIGPRSSGSVSTRVSRKSKQMELSGHAHAPRHRRRGGLSSPVDAFESKVNDLEVLHHHAMALAAEATLEATARKHRAGAGTLRG